MAEVLKRSEYWQWAAEPSVETMPAGLLVLLRERGVAPEDYLTYVESGGPAGRGAGLGIAGSPELDEIHNGIVNSTGKIDSEEVEIAVDDGAATIDPYEVLASGGAQTPEEQAAVDQITATATEDEITALFSATRGEADPRAVSWMFDGRAGGITVDQVDWSQLYRTAIALGGQDMQLPERLEGEPTDVYQRRTVMSLMAAGPTELNEAVWQSHLESTGNWASSFKIGDWYASDLKTISENYRVDLGEATFMARVGKQAKLDPGKAAQIWQWAKDTGIEMWSLGDDLPLPDPANRPFYDPSWAAEDAANARRDRQGLTVTTEQTQYMGPMNSEGGAYGAEYGYRYSLRDVFDMYQEKSAKYQNETVARVAMHDEDLAERLFNDPYSLTIEEIRNIDNLIGGADSVAGDDPAGANWLQQRLQGSGGETVKVDKDGAREAARQLAASWNMPGLDDAALDRVVNAVVGPQLQVIRKGLGNPFNPTIDDSISVINAPSPYAAAAKQMRQTGQYRELFGQMQDGESEEQYAGRFNSESQEILGDRSLEAVRAGMRSGSRNTVGQSALLSGEGSDSSTFRQRLAKLGDAFKGMT